MSGSIRREGKEIVIRLRNEDDAQSLRIALQPCPCKGAKSKKTAEIRNRLDRGLALAISQKEGF